MPFIIAVAATLVGCSREPPHQAITQSCADESQFAGLDRTAAPSIEFASFKADPAPETKLERPRHRASDRTAHLARTKAKPTLITAKTEPSANRTLLPPLPSSTQLESKSGIAAAGSIGQPTVGLAPNSDSRTIQEQVAAAITVAKRGTVAALAAAGLVAIVMARPEIRSVSDLEGKDVAMDEEYSESRNDILVAFVLKGAHPSQVSAGHSSAINRLLNGEVPAAVLALVSTDSAEGFPDIAGFKVFQVPLLRSPAGNRDTPKRSE
jgi:hypothetical protein